MSESLTANPWRPGVGVDDWMKASAKEDICPGCFPWCQQCCVSMICPPAWSRDIVVHLLLTGKVLRGVWSLWSHFRKLTGFANAELMQPCESRVMLCAGLIFVQHVKSIGEKKCQGLLKEELLYYFSYSDVFSSFYLSIFLGVWWLPCLRLITLSNQSLTKLGVPRVTQRGCLDHSYLSIQMSQTSGRHRLRTIHIFVCKAKLRSVFTFTAQAKLSRNAREFLPELQISQSGLWDFEARD